MKEIKRQEWNQEWIHIETYWENYITGMTGACGSQNGEMQGEVK